MRDRSLLSNLEAGHDSVYVPHLSGVLCGTRVGWCVTRVPVAGRGFMVMCRTLAPGRSSSSLGKEGESVGRHFCASY